MEERVSPVMPRRLMQKEIDQLLVARRLWRGPVAEAGPYNELMRYG